MRFSGRLLLLLVIALAGCREPAQSQQPQRVAPADAAALDRAQASIDGSRRTAITQAAEVVAPAVVSINVIEVRQVRYRDPFADDPFFSRFFGPGRDRIVQQQVQGIGSGFFITPDGYIVTNDHVAGNATRITVALPNGDQYEARLIGSDPETDIALLKVEADQPLPFLAFTEEQDPLVGEWAIALGNPFGLFEAAQPSVTVGVVSAVGRNFSPDGSGRVFRDMIQTDAAINQGNSGGPLVNSMGEVIGMNTFIFSQSGGSVGIGFAVPAWRVTRIVDELRREGRIDRTFYTGLNVRALNPRIAQALGLSEARGLIVESVDSGSPAERAGLRPYDVVTAIENETVNNTAEANAVLLNYRVGDQVRLRVQRDGSTQTVPLTLGTPPQR